jgi:predicted nucleic acid-binding protein
MPARRDLVINTGPVLALTAAGHLDVLREQFAKVIVPREVVQEVEAGGRTQFAREEFRAASWLEKRTTATSIPQLLQSTLDPGEAAVIAVATVEHIATVAFDETVGRRIGAVARTLGDGIARDLDSGQAARISHYDAARNCENAPTRNLAQQRVGERMFASRWRVARTHSVATRCASTH